MKSTAGTKKHPGPRRRSSAKPSRIETYKRETQKTIKRFMAHKLSFPDCIAALDAALAEFVPGMAADQLEELHTCMLANNEIVMREMERRGPQQPGTPSSGS